MIGLTLRFYQELNDFLPRARRQTVFQHSIPARASIKDVIESLGVPHTEVDLLLVNGASVDFAYVVSDGDCISVYPPFESLDVSSLQRVRAEPLRRPAFVVDGHLGRLAAYLRLFGFDTLYEPDALDADLAACAAREHRILLTRDRGLLKRRIVTRGYCPRSARPRDQLVEVLRRFDLLSCARPFSRCVRCNGRLEPVDARAVADRIPAAVRSRQRTFSACRACGKVYWKGSHYQRMLDLIAQVQSRLRGAGGIQGEESQ